MPTLDVREISPATRHDTIHEPKPLYYEMAAEVPSFDADGYEVERVTPDEFRATFPKEASR